MTSRNRLLTVVTLPICAAILLAGAGFASAGDLDPPAGPVAPTHKTLTEVEPRTAINAANTPGDADSLFKITQPGSYYLTGNITGVAGKHGIEIVASGVTVDLNGFDLVGVPAMGAFDGVTATAEFLSNIAVSNGSVRDWGRNGVDLATYSSTTCRVERVLARGNAGYGIRVGDGPVTNCSASGNPNVGIVGTTITNCSASSNGIGIIGSTVTNCSANQNTLTGIIGTTVTDCHATGSAVGIKIGNSNCGTATNCTAFGNGTGIAASTYTGPPEPAGATITNCSARGNYFDGFSVEDGCMVVNCSAIANNGNGIVCTSRCIIRDNNCAKNGVQFTDRAGILVTGTYNRLEGNNCTGAYRGIRVDGANNVIVRNTCSDNSLVQWTIAANNYYGPIIDRTGVVATVVSGSAAASTLDTTDPNANFTY